MIKFAWDMYKKYEEAINYLFFGFLAFLVNMVAYALSIRVLGADDDKVVLVLIATAFAWVVSVLFAYWTNRSFVFKSKVKDKEGIWKEFSAFVGARIVTGGMELVIMYVMVDLAGINNMISKFVCNVIVIVSNYIFSKLLVFKKKDA
ncbi:GtrA family protein [Lachnospiraceae bacterium]|nr:GtrA family protein [Lachnospiraceae bacterium]